VKDAAPPTKNMYLYAGAGFVTADCPLLNFSYFSNP